MKVATTILILNGKELESFMEKADTSFLKDIPLKCDLVQHASGDYNTVCLYFRDEEDVLSFQLKYC